MSFIRLLCPYMISSPASPAPFAVPVTGFTSNNVGCVNMKGLSIAFLYQMIPKCGTDGGVKLKEPLIEICGNFKCGNDQLKFIIDLILLIAPETTDLHPFQMLVNEDLIPFNTPVTVDFAPFIPLEIVDLIPFITEDTVDLIPFQTLLNTDLIEFKILVIVDFIALKTDESLTLLH